MRNNYDRVLRELVHALNGMSDSDLKLLAHVLGRRDVVFALQHLLQSTLKFRRTMKTGAGACPSTAPVDKPARTLASSARDEAIHSIDGRRRLPETFRAALLEHLNDRALFPSTRDVILAVNKAFRFRFRYEDYRRRGRDAFIKKCWQQIDSLPKARRHASLERFFHMLATRSGEGEYLELFRAIVGHE